MIENPIQCVRQGEEPFRILLVHDFLTQFLPCAVVHRYPLDLCKTLQIHVWANSSSVNFYCTYHAI